MMNSDWITDRPPTVDEVPDGELCRTTEDDGSVRVFCGGTVRDYWQAKEYGTIAWMMPLKPYVPPEPKYAYTTETISISVKIPTGWKFVRWDVPEKGEWYAFDGRPSRCDVTMVNSESPIICQIGHAEPTPEPDTSLAADIDTVLSEVEKLGFAPGGAVNRIIEAAKERDKLAERLDSAERIVNEMWETFYGQGMEVTNFHLNGDTEPIDEFFESNDWDCRTDTPEQEPDTSLAASIERYHSWKRDSAPVRPDLVNYIVSGLHDADFDRIIEAARKWNAANDPDTSLAECGAHCVLDTYGIKPGLIHDRVVLLGIKLDAVAKERDELKCLLQSEAMSYQATIQEEYQKREALEEERNELRARIAELKLEVERHKARTHRDHDDIVMLSNLMECKCTEPGYDNRLFAVMARKYESLKARITELEQSSHIEDDAPYPIPCEPFVCGPNGESPLTSPAVVFRSNAIDPEEGWRLLRKGDDPELVQEGDHVWIEDRGWTAVSRTKIQEDNSQFHDHVYRRRIAETQPANETIAEVAASLDAWADSPAAGLMIDIMHNMAKKLRGLQ